MRKRKLIMFGSISTLLLISLGLLLFSTRNNNEELFTGGSGKPSEGYLVLQGYDTRSNDSSKIPLGEFLTADQQAKIRSILEVLLFNEKPMAQYKGKIQAGSFDVDYRTNIKTFLVAVEDPKVTYSVEFNGISNEVRVFNEEGQLLDPTRE